MGIFFIFSLKIRFFVINVTLALKQCLNTSADTPDSISCSITIQKRQQPITEKSVCQVSVIDNPKLGITGSPQIDGLMDGWMDG